MSWVLGLLLAVGPVFAQTQERDRPSPSTPAATPAAPIVIPPSVVEITPSALTITLTDSSTTSAHTALAGTRTTATLTCPTGAGRLLGGGGTVSSTDPHAHVVLVSSYPAGSAAWSVTAQTLKNLATLHAMTVSAWGLCTP